MFGDLEMIVNGKDFMSEGALRMVLDQLGWTYAESLKHITNGEHNIEGEILPLRADFYPVGWKLAQSTKATIKCDGRTIIKYKDYTYISPWEIYDTLGEDALNDIDNWVFEEEREWCIKKLNGDWVTTFTYLTECPFRTKVRC
jgi:hypothetical protein